MIMKKCLACDNKITGEKRVMSRKKFCSNKCKSKYRTISGSRIDGHLWSNYRIREEQYNEIMVYQDFRCAICKVHQSEVSRSFAVDHDHRCCPGRKSCGRCIRGLLCFECNIGLGKFRDSPELLKHALNYVNNTGCEIVDIT